MIITREKGMRMWGGGSGNTSVSGASSGGGFSLTVAEGEGSGNAYTDFTYESGKLILNKATEFVTVDFFNKLFTAYDANGNVIAPNNTTPTLDNIKFKAGAWTEQYLSALGQNTSGGGGGGGISLYDVWQSLKTNTDDYANQKINAAHIPDLSGTYATKTWVNQQGFVTSSGVTSVAMTVPTGLSVSGSPITSTGTLALTFTSGYSIPTTAKQSNWDTAYGWGNHATAGYASESSVTTLQGYFTNGVANTAAKLNTGSTTYSVWGQTYWENGVPKSVSNTYMSGVTNIDSLLYFDTTNSRVGIGTSSPSYKLDVNGEVRGTAFRTTTTNGSYGTLNSRGSVHCYLDNYASGFATGMYVVNSSGDTLGSAAGIFGSSNAVTRYYYGGTYDSPLMSILPSGNVGIGTTSPSYKLHVNGYTSTTRLYLSSSVYLEYDSSKSGVHLVGAGFYSDSYVSALGANSSGGGGGGGIDLDAMWTELQGNTGTYANTKINVGHIPDLSASKITSGTLAAARMPDLSGIYLPLTGGTLSGNVTFNGVNKGIYLTDSESNTFAGIIQNSDNLWIGAQSTSATHHTGSTYISAGNGSVYISRLVSGTRSNYLVLDTGNYSSYALPLSGGTMTGNISMSSTSKGYYLVDSAGVSYAAIYDNGSNLWIGAQSTSATHHTGSTYISAGNGSVYISRLVSGTRSNYLVLDTGNYSSYALPLSGGTMTGPLAWSSSTALPNATSAEYLLTIDAFADGGTTKWIAASNVSVGKATADGDGNTISSTYLKLTGGTLTGSLAVNSTFTCRSEQFMNTNPSLGALDQGTIAFRGCSNNTFSSYGCFVWIDWSYGTTKFQGGYSNGTTTALPLSFQPLGGRVGIGTHSPSYPLHVEGNIYGSSEITAASDERKKNILSNTKFTVHDIASSRSVLYEWNDDRDKANEKKVHGGSIAQDWLGKADSFLMQDEDGFYSINYGALALCSAITIAKEVVKHEDEITRLKKEVVKLRERVAELEERRIA